MPGGSNDLTSSNSESLKNNNAYIILLHFFFFLFQKNLRGESKVWRERAQRGSGSKIKKSRRYITADKENALNGYEFHIRRVHHHRCCCCIILLFFFKSHAKDDYSYIELVFIGKYRFFLSLSQKMESSHDFFSKEQ